MWLARLPNDNALFAITGNQLRTNAVFNYEARHEYSVLVETRDLEGAAFQRAFTVLVEDENEPPVIVPGQVLSIDEGSTAGTIVAVVAASDPDLHHCPPSLLTYSIESDQFVINSETGEISVAEGVVLDHETQPSVALSVHVSDNGITSLSSVETITIHINNVAPHATISGAAPPTSPEGTLLELSSDVTDPGVHRRPAFHLQVTWSPQRRPTVRRLHHAIQWPDLSRSFRRSMAITQFVWSRQTRVAKASKPRPTC